MSNLTRRSFLRGTLAAAATVTIAGTKSSGKVLGANDTIRVAVAGLNGRGGSHVDAFAGRKGVQVVCLIGADPRTFAGLAGMGDLILTCTGALSRNRSVGVELGRGRTIEQILGGMTMVAEGVRTTRSARDLARRLGIEMPIVEEVHALLFEGRDARAAVESLMLREPKPEHWG